MKIQYRHLLFDNTIVRESFLIVNGSYVTAWRFVPHSVQKRALFSTVEEHCGQNRAGRGSFEPQSWQNFPGGPMRRQVGHITVWGKPGVLKPAMAAGVRGCCCPGSCCGTGAIISGVTAEGMSLVLHCGTWKICSFFF